MNGMNNVDPQTIKVPVNLLKTWESILNILSEIIGVPASLILRAYSDELEIVAVNSINDRYHVGEKHAFGSGLFCERVMTTQKELIVPDGREDEQWSDSPAVKSGLVSYMGYPIFWPNGQVFGTICILDEKANGYSEIFKELMARFKESIELGLFSIYMNNCLRSEVVRRRQAEAKLKISLSTARQLNEKLLRAKDMAENATRARSELVRKITEEVQNPINSIEVYCSMIARSDALSAEDRENADVIQNSVTRIKEIVDELVSKIE